MIASSLLCFTHSYFCVVSYGFNATTRPAHLGQLGEGLVDEDEGDEEGEDLLCEAGDEAHQEAALKGHHHDHYDNKPEPNPDSTSEVLHVVSLAELEAQNMLTHTK